MRWTWLVKRFSIFRSISCIIPSSSSSVIPPKYHFLISSFPASSVLSKTAEEFFSKMIKRRCANVTKNRQKMRHRHSQTRVTFKRKCLRGATAQQSADIYKKIKLYRTAHPQHYLLAFVQPARVERCSMSSMLSFFKISFKAFHFGWILLWDENVCGFHLIINEMMRRILFQGIEKRFTQIYAFFSWIKPLEPCLVLDWRKGFSFHYMYMEFSIPACLLFLFFGFWITV